MADKTHDTIDKSETPVVKRRGTALATPLLGIVIGLVGLVRGGHRILSLLSLAIGLVPVVAIVATRVSNLS